MQIWSCHPSTWKYLPFAFKVNPNPYIIQRYLTINCFVNFIYIFSLLYILHFSLTTFFAISLKHAVYFHASEHTMLPLPKVPFSSFTIQWNPNKLVKPSSNTTSSAKSSLIFWESQTPFQYASGARASRIRSVLYKLIFVCLLNLIDYKQRPYFVLSFCLPPWSLWHISGSEYIFVEWLTEWFSQWVI